MTNKQVNSILSNLLSERDLKTKEKEAIKVAIGAIDRLTPKRPHSFAESKAKFSKKLYKGYCPHCAVTPNTKRITRYSVEKHCNLCGQALDWKDRK